MTRTVSRSTLVAAPPEEIFELLARPQRHPEIDGSGTVQAPVGDQKRLALGSTFGMKMRMALPYRIVNTVVEFEEGRRIAWRHFHRHVWRWELEPVDGGTKVTETFDWSSARSPRGIELIKAPTRNAQWIEATLQRLVDRFGALEPDPTGR